MRETNPHVWIAALRASQDDFARLVGPMTAEQLAEPSYHIWTIGEVVKHVGASSALFDAYLDAALAGSAPPGPDAFAPLMRAWNDRAVDQLKSDALTQSERLVRRYEAFTDEELAHLRLNFFGIEMDAAALTMFRLTELSVHVWDIAVSRQPSATIAQPAVDLMVDDAVSLLVSRREPGDREFRLGIETTSPRRRFTLSAVAGKMRLQADESHPLDGNLMIPAEALIRLVYHRLDPDHTPHVSITGSVSLEDLRGLFPPV